MSHKKPTPQTRSYWSTCHSVQETTKLTCNQIHIKKHTDKTRHRTQPPQNSSNTPGGVQAHAFQPSDPYWKAFPLFDLQVGSCCASLCIHWVVQNTKQHIFLIHVQSLHYLRSFSCFSSWVSQWSCKKRQYCIQANYPRDEVSWVK